jgi:hypothetical protein
MAVYDTFAESFARSREKIWPDLEELMNLPELTGVHSGISYDL